MIDPTEFKKVVDYRFWKLALKLQPYSITNKKNKILDELCDQINKGQYSPGAPVIIIEQNKGFGVVRHIPVFNMRDYSVYYYCVRKLDSVLAKKRVQNTYGGW